MRAALLKSYNAPFEFDELPLPELGEGDVLVRVGACGVCGSDKFLQSGGFQGPLPIVPGHEAAGTIVGLGPGVDTLAVGQKVALYYIRHCGRCRYCRAGRENICVEVSRMGVDFNGAMAEYVAIPAVNCLPLDAGMDLAAAAVITDAIGTPTHALRQARIEPGDPVLVMGIGGIGSNAVQVAKVMGAQAIAASRSDRALANARALGADAAIKSDENLPEAVRDLTAGLGVAAVIQCAPAVAAYETALRCLRKAGRLVVVGTSGAAVPIAMNQVLWHEQEIVGSRGFTRDDIRQGLAWYESGAIAVDHLVRHRRPLEELNEAIADLGNPEIVRTVIQFG